MIPEYEMEKHVQVRTKREKVSGEDETKMTYRDP